ACSASFENRPPPRSALPSVCLRCSCTASARTRPRSTSASDVDRSRGLPCCCVFHPAVCFSWTPRRDNRVLGNPRTRRTRNLFHAARSAARHGKLRVYFTESGPAYSGPPDTRCSCSRLIIVHPPREKQAWLRAPCPTLSLPSQPMVRARAGVPPSERSPRAVRGSTERRFRPLDSVSQPALAAESARARQNRG